MKTLTLLISIIMLTLTVGCASNLTGSSYSRDEARKVQQVEFATVEAVRPVVIEGTKSQIGTVAGSVVGGVAGNTVGEGAGSQIVAAMGAVLGGVAGAAAEEGFTRSQGVEITVRSSSGNVFSVVQKADPNEVFNLGDRVRVLRIKGNVRVAH